MRFFLPTLLAGLCLALPAPTQDDPPVERGDVEHALASRARYLAVRPYHDKVFADLVEALLAQRRLAEWIERYEERAAGGKEADVVLLARLHDRSGNRARALELLEGLGDAGAERDLLVGALHLEAGQPGSARRYLAAAVEDLAPGLEREQALRKLAEAQLLLGEREAAAAALRRLAEDATDPVEMRLEVAELCARGGLRGEAIAHYGVAEELAGTDPVLRSRVLAALGELHERELDPTAAVASYEEALTLLQRGHWLADELLDRVTELHRRRGTLLGWREELARAQALDPGDLDVAERLARAHLATGQAEQAIAVLMAAARRHPGDRALVRRRLELARSHGTAAQRITVLQAALAVDEHDRELRYELAEALAEEGGLEAARHQWELLLADARIEPEELARVARRYAVWGDDARALALYEEALRRAPADIGRHADLARHLAGQGQGQQASDGLVAAESQIAGARALEELGALQKELGFPARAEAPWRRASELLPGDQRLTLEIALLLVELRRGLEGREQLRELIGRATDLGVRDRALRAFVDTYRSQPAMAIAAEEQSQLAREQGDRGAFLIAIALLDDLRDGGGARELLEDFLAGSPDDRPSRERLVTLLVRQEDHGEALAQLAELIARHPAGAREWRLQRAKLHAGDGRIAEASAELEALVDAEPKDAKALEAASQAFAELGRPDRAIEVLGRSLELGAVDPVGHLRLARLCLEDFRFAEAHQHLRAAYRDGSGDVRRDALVSLYELMVSQGRVKFELDALKREVAERPFDLPAALLLVDLNVAQREFRGALDLLAVQLERRPYDPRLFHRRAEIHGQIGMYEEAVQDLEAVIALVNEAPPELAYDLLKAHLSAGQVEQAGRVALSCEDPLRAARILTDAGKAPAAAELLDQVRRAAEPDPEVERRLGELHASLGRVEEAMDAFRRYLDRGGRDPSVLRQLGDLHWSRGERDEAVELGRRLVGAGGSPQAARGWFEEKGLIREWESLRCERILAHPRDAEGVTQMILDVGSGRTPAQLVHGETLLALIALALDEGLAPPGRSPMHWARWLLEQQAAVLGRAEDLLGPRLLAARNAIDAAGVSADRGAALDLVYLGATPGDEARMQEVAQGFADDVLILIRVADWHATRGEHDQAALAFGRVAAGMQGPTWRAAQDLEDALVRRGRAQELRAKLTYAERRVLAPPQFDAVLDVAEAALVFQREEVTCPLDARSARLRQVQHLAAGGEGAAARAALAELGADATDQPIAAARLARCAALCQFEDLARAWAQRLDGIVRALEEQAECAAALEATNASKDLFGGLGQHYRAAGQGVTAFDLLRDLRRHGLARDVARAKELRGELVGHYQSRLRERMATMPAGARDAAWWSAARELHDLAVKLGELHEWNDDPKAALATWALAAPVLGNDLSVMRMRAIYGERSGQRDEALTACRGVIAILDGVDAPPPEAERDLWLVPQVQSSEPRARRSVTWGFLRNFAVLPEQDPRLAHLLACLRLELELGRHDEALATQARLVDLAQDPPASWARNFLHMLTGYVDDQPAESSRLLAPEELHRFHAELYRMAPQLLQVVEAYAKSCWDGDELDTAEEVLRTFMAADPAISRGDRRKLERMLESTDQLRRVRHGQPGEGGGR